MFHPYSASINRGGCLISYILTLFKALTFVSPSQISHFATVAKYYKRHLVNFRFLYVYLYTFLTSIIKAYQTYFFDVVFVCLCGGLILLPCNLLTCSPFGGG